MHTLTEGSYALMEGESDPRYVGVTKREPQYFQIAGFLYEADGSPVPSLLPAPKIRRVYNREDATLYGYNRHYDPNAGYRRSGGAS